MKTSNTILEKKPLEKACKNKQLTAYKFLGFWKCMDTIKDKNELNDMWFDNKPTPWKIW